MAKERVKTHTVSADHEFEAAAFTRTFLLLVSPLSGRTIHRAPSTNAMKVQKKQIPYELGRRLDSNQGPRRLANSQAVGDKYATEKPKRNLFYSRKQKKKQKKQTTSNPKKAHLSVLQLNVDGGLSSKKIELAKTLNDLKIHVALLQETTHNKNSNIHISGYTPYACECTGCRGIVTYIRNDVIGDCKHLKGQNETDIQKSTICLMGKKFTIYNIYSPPASTCQIDDLQDTVYRNTIIAGDFNGHSPQWGYPDTNNTGKYLMELNETTNLLILQDANSPPTLLHKRHNTLSRPDLTIVSSELSPHCETQVLPGFDSDHQPILTKITDPKLQTTPQERKSRWNFRKAKWPSFTATLEEALTNDNEDHLTVNELEEKFTTSILRAAGRHIPRGSCPQYKPFWNEDIEQAITQRRQTKRDLKMTPSAANKTKYNKASAVVKRKVLEAKRAKWTTTCSTLDLRKDGRRAWTLLNNLSAKNRKTNPTLMSDGETPLKRAEKLNKFFASVNKAKKDNMSDPELLKELKEMEKTRTTKTIPLFEDDFTMEELQHALQKLKLRKAPGPDKVHNEMLKHLGPNGKKVLLRLINLTWEKGTLPKSWKNAHITPILKKGKEPSEPKSYRPISLTSCLSKVAERMVNRRLYWFLEDSGLLCEEQAGFRANSRTDDQLFRLCQNIQDGFQEGDHTVAVFVDLQQAYDRVWRKGLLLKMLRMGIHGKLYLWIKNFLLERTIQTTSEKSLSSKQTLEEGLPQGSALSCTLFLLFINDMPCELQSRNALYADDLVLWKAHRYARQSARHLNRDLEKLSAYCKKWKLTINPSKTVYTTFTLSPKAAKAKLNIKIDGHEATKEDHPTYLGVQLDPRLTLSTHIENLKNKAVKRLSLIKCLATTKWGSDMNTLRSLYIGYVRSMLDYNQCLQIACSKSNQDTLDKVQNHALRFICGGMKSSPTSACEIHTNVEPLGLRREKAALEMYERSKRMSHHHPLRKLVEDWQPKNRIKNKSILHHVETLRERHHLPEERAPTPRVCSIPPNAQPRPPEIRLHLKEEAVNKKSDPVILKRMAEDTVHEYPQDWIHVYTDGSAFKATVNAGCGAWISFPDGNSVDISEACGNICSIFEAELKGIQAALNYLTNLFQQNPSSTNDIVIFTDSRSGLEAMKSGENNHEEVLKTITAASSLLSSSPMTRLILQWIPGHSDVHGNDKADKLAKNGASLEQPSKPVSILTAKQILKKNYREEWMNLWASGTTGRPVYRHMSATKPNDNIRVLERKEQCTIFRLRSTHAPVNYHLNMMNPEHPPMCELCNNPYETTHHILFNCPKLQDIREQLLPPVPDTENCLYSTKKQLRNTSTFFNMALGRRAKARAPLD